jgi:tetratricopeptide (TPR) repeat protein
MMLARTLAALLAVSPAPGADAARRDAVAAWQAQDWAAAADAFDRAFELDPRPEYLWGRAQALRFGGDCRDAIEAYEAFIATGPPDVDEQTARTNITRCQSALGHADPGPQPAQTRAAVPTPTPVVATQPPAPSDDPPRAPARRWYADPAGIGLFASGLAVAGVGAGLTGHAHVVESRAFDAPTERQYRDDIAAGRRFEAVGIACLAVSGALIVAGTVRFVVVGRRSRRSTAWLRHGLAIRF